MKIILSLFLLTACLTAPLLAQATSGDSTAGYTFVFVDNDSDGINDNYQMDKLTNPDNYTNSTYNLQYKYEFGTGYGYGFSDNDQNGTNDIVDNSPNITGTNPTVGVTRLDGLEMIKWGTIRHGKATEPAGFNQREKDHVLHDGHCKDEAKYQYFRNLGN